QRWTGLSIVLTVILLLPLLLSLLLKAEKAVLLPFTPFEDVPSCRFCLPRSSGRLLRLSYPQFPVQGFHTLEELWLTHSAAVVIATTPDAVEVHRIVLDHV